MTSRGQHKRRTEFRADTRDHKIVAAPQRYCRQVSAIKLLSFPYKLGPLGWSSHFLFDTLLQTDTIQVHSYKAHESVSTVSHLILRVASSSKCLRKIMTAVLL